MSNKELEQKELEIAQLEEVIYSLKKRIDDSGEDGLTKSDFLATISHEIRTPMNGVMGMLELLLNTPVNDRQQYLAKTAHDSAVSLLSVITNIFDHSKIESGKIKLHKVPFNLQKLLDDVVNKVAKRAQIKCIELNTHIPTNIEHEVIGDPARLYQIIENLLDNAVKFTDTGVIELTTNTEIINDHMQINVSVSDTGKGIDHKNQKIIFEPFEQEGGSISTRQFGGTGLGLTLTHDLIKLMNGEISVQSKVGEGSTFAFSIRLLLGNKANTTQSSQAFQKSLSILNNTNPSEKRTHHARILLAEDNPINKEVIYEQMAMLGYNIEIVDNGRKALAAIKINNYDLILMDAHMPQLDGFSATQAIRTFEKENNRDTTPIIALTADISPGVQAHCAAVGMNDYIAKPILIEDVKIILNKWLGDAVIEEEIDKASELHPVPASANILDMSVIEQLRILSNKSGRNTLSNAIKQFNTSAIEQLNLMQHAATNDDLKELASIAHNLKSSSGTLGITQVYAAATEIEQFAIEKNTKSAQESVASLEKILDLSLQALQDLTIESSQSGDISTQKTATPVVGNGQQLLIVDDDRITLDTLQKALQQLGYKVHSVSNGKGALALLEKYNYDLIITDLQMPDMDGYGLCEAIRKNYAEEILPILVLTSTANDVHVHDAYEIGISNFIVKPVNFLNLAYTILFTIQNARNSHELWHNRQLLEVAEHAAQVSHWSWDIDNQQIQFSSHLQRYFNPSLTNIKTLNDFITAVGHSEMDTAINTCLASGKESTWEQEIINPEQEEKRYILHRFRIIHNENNDAVLIGTVQEISSIRRAEQRIIDLAFYDSLTKLNSRSCFNKKLQDLLINAKRKTEKFAILYLDIDNFKNINDSFGHDVGDKLLIVVADRLRTLLREADFASRLGGDEFCLLIHDIADNLSAANVAQRCLELLSQPVELAGRTITPHASIGIAIYPHNGNDSNFLLKAADTAMYEAKNKGKNQYAFYESAMTDAAHLRLTIENDLRAALRDEQFELYYQPKISLSSGNVESVEALIRWNHPEKGLCPPDSFIPEAERMGLIAELGEWVVRTACEQIKLWRSQGIGDIPVAVNISPSHFEQENFADDIANLVDRLDISPSLIEIEITESTSRDHSVFINTCRNLRALGFRTAIDDFGTGYSSLSVLKDAAVDILKIDREFVRHLPNDSQSSILIGTILGMSKALGLQVVAEGIETEEQLTVLVAMGCHMAQGYYFSKPVPAKEIPALTKVCFRRPKANQVVYK